MHDLIKVLVQSGQLSEEQAAAAVERGEKTAHSLTSSPEAVADFFEKTGAPGFLNKIDWGATALPIGMAFGTAIAAKLGDKAVEAISHSFSKNKHFDNMVESNPYLSELDPGKVRRAFDTLHKFNPAYASDPTVAASFVEKSVTLGTVSDHPEALSIPPDWVHALTQAHRNIQGGSGPGMLGQAMQRLPHDMLKMKRTDRMDEAVDRGSISNDEANQARLMDDYRAHEEMMQGPHFGGQEMEHHDQAHEKQHQQQGQSRHKK